MTSSCHLNILNGIFTDFKRSFNGIHRRNTAERPQKIRSKYCLNKTKILKRIRLFPMSFSSFDGYVFVQKIKTGNGLFLKPV